MTWKSELDTFWNTYRKEMASLGLGTALWQPSPPIDTNTGSYVYKQVEAGDVGFIHAGVFNRLFNIFLPEDHEWQQTFGVPHGFKPLKVPGRHHWTSAESFLKELAPLGGTLGPAPLHSESVKCHKVTLDVEGNSSIPIPAIQFKFSCTKQAGAALVLPHRAERYDTMRSKLMEKYMTDNWESWLDFTERLGMDVELQDLYLVTGCDRTDEWAMAAFRRSESEIAASATIIVPGAANVTAAFSCKWETTSSVLHNTGPYRPTSSTPTDDSSQRDKATLCNQTVFIRGYRMKKRKNWKGKQVAPVVIRASAGYDERDLGPGDDEGSAGCSSSTSSDEEDDTRQDIPDPKDVNLLDPVLDYILQSCPEADVAIAHDEDIYPYIMGMYDPDVILSRMVCAGRRTISENGVACLQSDVGLSLSVSPPQATSWASRSANKTAPWMQIPSGLRFKPDSGWKGLAPVHDAELECAPSNSAGRFDSAHWITKKWPANGSRELPWRFSATADGLGRPILPGMSRGVRLRDEYQRLLRFTPSHTVDPSSVSTSAVHPGPWRLGDIELVDPASSMCTVDLMLPQECLAVIGAQIALDPNIATRGRVKVVKVIVQGNSLRRSPQSLPVSPGILFDVAPSSISIFVSPPGINREMLYGNLVIGIDSGKRDGWNVLQIFPEEYLLWPDPLDHHVSRSTSFDITRFSSAKFIFYHLHTKKKTLSPVTLPAQVADSLRQHRVCHSALTIETWSSCPLPADTSRASLATELCFPSSLSDSSERRSLHRTSLGGCSVLNRIPQESSWSFVL